jgi:hypothetical protein
VCAVVGDRGPNVRVKRTPSRHGQGSGDVDCPYDTGWLEPGIVGFAARTHPVIDEDTGQRASAAYTEPDLVIAQLNQPLPDVRSAQLPGTCRLSAP